MITQSSRRQEEVHPSNPLVAVASRAADVAGDFVELAELQVKLVKLDAESAAKKSGPVIVGVAFCSVLALSATTILLNALSAAIAEVAGLSVWVSQLIVGNVALAFVAVVVSYFVRRFRNGLGSFSSSMNQLSENVAWIKSVVRGR